MPPLSGIGRARQLACRWRYYREKIEEAGLTITIDFARLDAFLAMAIAARRCQLAKSL